jgi:hypothetical protein
MTDEKTLIERLRAGTGGGGKHWMLLHEEAADEITRLTALNSSLTDKGNSYIVDNARLAADLARMRNDVHSCGTTCSNAECVAARQAGA